MNPDGRDRRRCATGATAVWSPDGAKIAFSFDGPALGHLDRERRRIRRELPDRRTTMPHWQPIPVNSYPRPKGATPSRFSLVTAYEPVHAPPNRTHGPPLAFRLLQPAREELALPDGRHRGLQRRRGRERGLPPHRVVVGNPSTPADEADVTLDGVGLRRALHDYEPARDLRRGRRLQRRHGARRLHRRAPGGALRCGSPTRTTHSRRARRGDRRGLRRSRFVVPCTANRVARAPARPARSTTSVDALVPGAVKEGRRAVWELDRVHVKDGGADGEADTTRQPRVPDAGGVRPVNVRPNSR